MLMLMVTWEPPTPPDNTPLPDPESRFAWVKFAWIFFAVMAGLYLAVLFLTFYFRDHGPIQSAGLTPLLAFPSELALTIRRRVYRRSAQRLTAEERRRVYLLNMGRLDTYELEFGAPPLPFQRKEGAEGSQSNRPNTALMEASASGRCSGEGRVQDGTVGGIHWAAVLIAREHKLQQGDDWTCGCSCCSDVRQTMAACCLVIAAGGA